jgi:2-keto-4-pentenoate hydratase/2-oxohepta-3-ene-1,7-dioic acid hydratase in catechol pathway
MILLSAVTPSGAQLAIKTNSGVTVLENVAAGKSALPATLQEALLIPGGLERVRDFVRDNAAAIGKAAKPETEIQLASLFTPRNVICIGLNYRDHAAEGGVPIPEKPVVFAKLNGCIVGPNAPIILPPETQQVDYEAELAVVIGHRCKGVSESNALKYVAGYTCLNDVSARDFQFGDNQWVRSKSQDTFGPMGPYLVTSDEIPDPQTLPIRCVLNGQVLQNSNTDKMIFGVRYLISFLSCGITLEPGDVISTGTPHGVGFARKPPVFLKADDEVVVEIDGIGRLSNPVKAHTSSAS